LQEKKWDVALQAIQQAATLDARRFAPFPMQRYQSIRILGAGGFGTAFLCHDRNFDEDVVVKTLHAADMERSMEAVFQEARILRKLLHTVIIGVHECEYADSMNHARPYIVMDYFPGGSLEEFIQQRGTLSPEDLIVVANHIADGINAAHAQNILHRDLKPDNVLVRKEGNSWKVKIIDFGLALRKQTIETSIAMNSAGGTIQSDSVAGTRKYAPPEQMGEMKGVQPGPYSDVYAFGKLCCYALFKSTEPKNRHWAAISKDLHEMLERCTEEELEHRLSSFEPVLKVLENLKPTQAQRNSVQNESVAQPQLERKRGEQEEATRIPHASVGDNLTAASHAGLADKQAWLVVQQQQTLAAYEQYIDTYPQGIHVKEARESVCGILRKVLAHDLCSVRKRKRYLAIRTGDYEIKDGNSLPASWYLLFATLVGLLTGLVVSCISIWIGSWYNEWWLIIRIPAKLITVLFVAAIGGATAGWLFGGVVGVAIARLAKEKGHKHWEGGAIIGFSIGIIAGPMCVFFSAATALAIGSIIGIILGMSLVAGAIDKGRKMRKKLGPLPFGAEITANEEALWKTYLDLEKPPKDFGS
jgi:hypothetical protein